MPRKPHMNGAFRKGHSKRPCLPTILENEYQTHYVEEMWLSIWDSHYPKLAALQKMALLTAEPNVDSHAAFLCYAVLNFVV